jgi:hypothetical protein
MFQGINWYQIQSMTKKVSTGHMKHEVGSRVWYRKEVGSYLRRTERTSG